MDGEGNDRPSHRRRAHLAYRALCVARGDARPLPGFEENEYVAATDFESRPLTRLIAEYRVVRAATLALFGPLTAEEWR